MVRKFSFSLVYWWWIWCFVPVLSEGSEIREPVRAAYVGIDVIEQQPEVLARLQRHGFTLALIADGSFRWQESRWQTVNAAAETARLPVIAVIHFAVPQELRGASGSYRSYVNRSGEEYAKTPCPTDAAYWQTVIGEQVVRFAGQAGSGMLGVVFDAEMYGSDINWYTDLCYCDACWQRFCASKPTVFPSDIADIPAGSRFQYLMRYDLLQEYTTVQWHQVRGILADIERQVHHIRPGFKLGFLCYRHNWFFTAVVHGLGTEDNPALVFSESSYVRGYTPYVDAERDHVLGNRRIAEYIPGIWLERFAPETLSTQLVDAALHTDGYWLFASGQFWLDAPQTRTWRLNGANDAYWLAMQAANAELRRLTDLPASSHRTISPVKPSSFYDSARQQLLTTAALRDFLATALEIPAFSDGPVTYRGHTLFHCLTFGAGSVQVTHVPLGKDTDPELLKRALNPQAPVAYQIFDDQGLHLNSGEIHPSHSPKTLTFPTDGQGLVSILLSPETNGVQVSFSGCSCVAEASSTYPLATFQSAQTYPVYVPPATARLNLRVEAPRQESSLITVHSPCPRVGQPIAAQQIAAQWFTELHTGNAVSQAASLWWIQVEPSAAAPFGDVRFYLYDAEFPYVRVP